MLDSYTMMSLNTTNYNSFLNNICNQEVFIDYVVKNHNVHSIKNEIILLFIKNIKTDELYLLNQTHQDLNFSNLNINNTLNLIIQKSKKIFVTDKKKFIHLFKIKNVNDVLIFKFQKGTDSLDETVTTNYHDFIKYKNIDDRVDVNYIIPASKHIELFEKNYKKMRSSMTDFYIDESFSQLNGIITETLAEVESNGLYVDVIKFNEFFKEKEIEQKSNFVYTEYNLFTSTGRPSNRFGKINYAALNKEDGCRSAFVSRFGDDGMLLSIDYSAYHPHIIANLINYKLDLSLNIYEYLAKQYFEKEEITVEDLKKAKNLTFQNLYGGVREEYKNIDYFKKVDEYITHRWDFFNQNQYVETPIFKRRITNKHIHDANPNKLFNYLLQAAETEFSIQNINRVNHYLKNKKSKVVLYTYDSILVDVCKDDKKDTLVNIKTIMVDNQFPVKCHIGKNYQDLVSIDI